MIDELLLITGNDILFSQANIVIHQPHLKEIGILGELNFLTGVQFLLFDKNKLLAKDKNGLEAQSNFDIFMSVMNSRDKAKHKTDALMVLALLFPEAKLKIEADKILLQLENFSSSINETNFNEFQNIVTQMFCLGESAGDGEFNPADDLARKIAEKIKKAKQAKAKKKGENVENTSIYARCV